MSSTVNYFVDAKKYDLVDAIEREKVEVLQTPHKQHSVENENENENVNDNVNGNDKDDPQNKAEISEKIYYLYQEDFEVGTFRIQTSGIYVIMEDITFNFNSGTGNEASAWLPSCDQTDTYPGACDYRDPYFMGFFAGITIECSDVIIDLNGHTLKQSIEMYYQQRWFSIIELDSQPFMPAQGPGMFGPSPYIATNVEIKNGVFGLTSHHAIHGNRNKYIHIHDIEIRDFETHGIQLNGFESVKIYNVKIHDSSRIAYLKGSSLSFFLYLSNVLLFFC